MVGACEVSIRITQITKLAAGMSKNPTGTITRDRIAVCKAAGLTSNDLVLSVAYVFDLEQVLLLGSRNLSCTINLWGENPLMDSESKVSMLRSSVAQLGSAPDRHQCQAWRHSQILFEMSQISREPHAHVRIHAALALCA